MHQPDERKRKRDAARDFERSLPAEQRKRLGQFFSGIPLGKLLGHLAIDTETRSVLDPMAGHGDLLDAVLDVADERGIRLERVEGIEIDAGAAAVARDRFAFVAGQSGAPGVTIHYSNAFDPSVLKELPRDGYDLVITNPPYVRYQAQEDNASGGTRAALIGEILRRLDGDAADVWKQLATGFSGLADLSVPSWILSALLVRPGGRLAIIVPSTWRTRDYGDVIRYLMLRCFSLEIIVEDTQPGWFSDALVRTQLIIARRLGVAEQATPLHARTAWPEATRIVIAPKADGGGSIVGNAFSGSAPEEAFARWVRDGGESKNGLEVAPFRLDHEWHALCGRAKSRAWFRGLEESAAVTSPGEIRGKSSHGMLPEAIRGALERVDIPMQLLTLEEAGVAIGQGLRTGCNRFFYVDAVDVSRADCTRVRASDAFAHREFDVPNSAVQSVVRRQAELPLGESAVVMGRVLDLRSWVLPEDMQAVAAASATYRACGEMPPACMPPALADYVRSAATVALDHEGVKFAPRLSAVHTNARVHRPGVTSPRFWYMLPDFMPRHRPLAFVARVNNGTPWVECNQEGVLVDANFSTFWTSDARWSRFALKALLNSAWCRLFMEVLGTPMGGGALKLEATHLRQLLIPILPDEALRQLDSAGRGLTPASKESLRDIDDVIAKILGRDGNAAGYAVAQRMTDRADDLRRQRRRTAA